MIKLDLVVLLKLSAGLTAIAVAYDKATYAMKLVDWQLPKHIIIINILGLSSARFWYMGKTRVYVSPKH